MNKPAPDYEYEVGANAEWKNVLWQVSVRCLLILCAVVAAASLLARIWD